MTELEPAAGFTIKQPTTQEFPFFPVTFVPMAVPPVPLVPPR